MRLMFLVAGLLALYSRSVSAGPPICPPRPTSAVPGLVEKSLKYVMAPTGMAIEATFTTPEAATQAGIAVTKAESTFGTYADAAAARAAENASKHVVRVSPTVLRYPARAAPRVISVWSAMGAAGKGLATVGFLTLPWQIRDLWESFNTPAVASDCIDPELAAELTDRDATESTSTEPNNTNNTTGSQGGWGQSRGGQESSQGTTVPGEPGPNRGTPTSIGTVTVTTTTALPVPCGSYVDDRTGEYGLASGSTGCKRAVRVIQQGCVTIYLYYCTQQY